jgi:hypothetical protein
LKGDFVAGKLSDDSDDEKNTQDDVEQQGYTYMDDDQSYMEAANSQQYQVKCCRLSSNCLNHATVVISDNYC